MSTGDRHRGGGRGSCCLRGGGSGGPGGPVVFTLRPSRALGCVYLSAVGNTGSPTPVRPRVRGGLCGHRRCHRFTSLCARLTVYLPALPGDGRLFWGFASADRVPGAPLHEFAVGGGGTLAAIRPRHLDGGAPAAPRGGVRSRHPCSGGRRPRPHVRSALDGIRLCFCRMDPQQLHCRRATVPDSVSEKPRLQSPFLASFLRRFNAQGRCVLPPRTLRAHACFPCRRLAFSCRP